MFGCAPLVLFGSSGGWASTLTLSGFSGHVHLAFNDRLLSLQLQTRKQPPGAIDWITEQVAF